MKVETAYDYSWRPLPTMQCLVSAHVLLRLTFTRVASICHVTLVTTRATSSFSFSPIGPPVGLSKKLKRRSSFDFNMFYRQTGLLLDTYSVS